jgi:hypothetical protein
LFFKVLLKNIEDCFRPEVKEAIRNYQLGFARALSIGGKWFFDDPKNPKNLTRAYLYEISGVGVGADEDALCNTEKPKSIENGNQLPNGNDDQLLIKVRIEALNKLIKERKNVKKSN